MFKKIFFMVIVVVLAAVAWFIFVKKPVILNRFFSQKTVGEQAIVSSTLDGQVNDLNPYEEAYTNPFE